MKLATLLGKDTCAALIGMHSFTGCDSVSAFGGCGKVSAMKLVLKDKTLRDTMCTLGQEWTLTNDLFLKLQQFTCLMYSKKTTVAEVNELRYQLFRAKTGAIESGQLPPCEDCLFLHALRANYQAAIWRNSLEKYPVIPNAVGNGWILEEDQLSVEWMRGRPAPEIVLEFMACKCVKHCKLPSCQCLSNGFSCTSACKLQHCENMPEEQDDTPIEDFSDDDYEDDAKDQTEITQ